MAQKEFEVGDVVKVVGYKDKLFDVIGYEYTYRESHGNKSSVIIYILKPEGSYEELKKKAYDLIYFGKKASKEKNVDRMLDEYNKCMFEFHCNRYMFSETGNLDYSLASANWQDQALAIMKELKLIVNGE